MKKTSTQIQNLTDLIGKISCSFQLQKIPISLSLMTIIMSIFSGEVLGQYSGTITVPSTNFPTLQAAIDSLNQSGLSGATTVNVTSGNPQNPSATTNGYILGSTTLNASMSSTNTLTFNGNGNTINGYVGTRSTTSTVGGSGNIDAMFVIKGTDYVTINNFVFTDPSSNTTTTTAMEAAIAMFNFTGASGSMDGCQNIYITNCTFNLLNISTYSYCVWASPYLYGSTAALTWSVPSDVLYNINITNNTMNEGYNFAIVRGLQDVRATRINISDNTVNNLGGGSTANYGLATYYGDTLYMNNNVVTQDGNQTTTAYLLYPYYTAGDYNIINNTINFKRSVTNAITTYGIYAYGYFYSAVSHPSTFTIRKNDFNWITNPVVTTTTSNSYYGVYHYAYGYNYNSSSYQPCVSYIDSNTMVDDTIQGSGSLYNYAFSATIAGYNKLFYKNNRLENVVKTGSGGTTYGIYTYGWGDTCEISENIYNNYRYNPASSVTGTATIYIFAGYHSAGGVKPLVHDNTITNIGVSGTFTSTSNIIGGTYINSTTNDMKFYNNKIHNLYINSSTTGGGSIYGIYGLSTLSNFQAFNNVVDSLWINNTSTGTTGNIYGYYHTSAGTSTLFNNYFGDFKSNSTSSGVGTNGIYSSSTAALGLYNNTIYLGRTSALSSSSASYGGAGVYYNTGGSVDMQNNIIHINATPGTSGNFACVRRTSGTNGTKPANFTGNNNTYYINSGTRNYYYCEGTSAAPVNGYTEWAASGSYTNDAQFDGPCSAYKAFMQGESNTVSNTETWVAGPVANTFQPSGASLSESSAVVLSLTTNDLNGAGRGANPDRGALQFSGTAVDLFAPIITYTFPSNIFCTTPPSLSAEITDISGVNTTSGTRPRLYYKKSTDNNTFAAANTSSGNGWKWVEASNTTSPFTFTVDYSLLQAAVATGDVIEYFVVAQDNATTPNVGTNMATYTGGCPASVNIAATTAITGVTNTNSYTVGTSPTFSVLLSPDPSTACQYDTISHMVIMPNPGASFPTYSLGTTYATSNLYWDIDSFQIGSYINATACAGGGSTTAVNSLPASVANRYSNYTSNGIVTDVIAGNTYPWKIVMNNSIGNSYTLAYAMFIDFNRNGTFEIPDERVAYTPSTITMTSSSTSCGPYPAWEGTFTVPTTGVSSGPTLCRVVGTYSTVIPTPTTAYTYGETEDYMINIIAAPDPSISSHIWTSNKTGSTILGTDNPLIYPANDSVAYYTDTLTISGCQFVIKDTVNINPAPKTLRVFNDTMCGAGVPPITFRVSDSNGFSSPIINWYADMMTMTPLQSSTDTVYNNIVGATSTFYVAVQNPTTGCWSARVPISLLVNPSDSILGLANGVRDSIRVCSGNVLNLTASNVQSGGATKSFDTFYWSSSDPTYISSPVATTNGTYSFTPSLGGNTLLFVQAIDTGTNCKAVDTVILSVQTNPFAGGTHFLTALPNPACIGTPITHTVFGQNQSATGPTGYGASSATNNDDECIHEVSVGSLTNNSSCTGASATSWPAGGQFNLPVSAPNQYSNYTNGTTPMATPDIVAGTSVPWSIKIGYDATNTFVYTNGYSIFIDYNRDGVFQSSEKVAGSTATNSWGASSGCTATSPGLVSGNFTVPTTITPGKTLMRVVVIESTASPAATGTYGWGETEDYTVNLVGVVDTNMTKLSWTSNQTGATVLGTDNPLVHSLPAASTIYNVKMTNGVCIDSLKDTITNNVPPLTINTINGTTSVCAGETIKLTVTSSGGCIPHTYNWYMVTGAGTITSLGTGDLKDSITLALSGATGAKTIRCVVTDNIGNKDSVTHVISFNNPMPTAVVSDTICGLNTATLCATSSVTTDVLRWYNSATSFQVLAEGNCYTTPALNQETVYYVRQFTSLLDSCEQPSTTYTYYNYTPSNVINFDYYNRIQANKRVIVQSVDIVPSNTSASASAPIAGTVNIGIYDLNGTLVGQSGNIDIMIPNATSASSTATPVTIPIGVVLNPGIYDMKLISASTSVQNINYAYFASGFQPQWTSSGNFGVIAGMLGANAYNYYNWIFWNYQIEEGCWGAAVADTVKYVTPPTLTLSRDNDSVCSGQVTTPVTVTAPSPLSTYNSYTWAPSTNISGDSSAGYVFSNATVGTHSYVLTGVQTGGLQCVTTDTFTLKVKDIPATIVKIPSAASVDICNGTVQQLEAVSGNSATGKVGNGTLSNTGTFNNPFYAGWENEKIHVLVTASELSALGFASGNIDSIGLTVTTSTPTYDITDFSIKMAHTANTSLTTWGTPTGSFTTVFPSTNIGKPATGLYRFPFSTPFSWDGTSNVLIEFCKTNDASASGTFWGGTHGVEATTTSSSMTYGSYADDVSQCPTPTGTNASSTNRPNVTFYQQTFSPITWSPVTSLYTNSGATTAYTGTNKDTVYAAPADTIKYYMTATHSNGCAISDSITVNVKDSVTINTQPPALTNVCLGDTIKISIAASSTSPLSYQWKKNGLNISAGVNPSAATNMLVIPNSVLSDSGIYEVVVSTGSPCSDKTSIQAVVKVIPGVTITTQPSSHTYVCQNSAFNASITANNVLTYQWQKDGVNVSNGTGGTTANYSIASTQPGDAGIYTVVMTANSPCPSVTSTNDTLSVTTLAAITTPPTGFTVCEDQAINISGTATNAASYQWLFNGSPIAPTAGTTNPYSKALATMADSGLYQLVALSANAGATVCKADTSAAVLGNIIRKIQITTQPLANTYVCQNSAFNASISANNVTSYQWKKNGVNVSNGTGGTTANYNIASTQPADAGIYTVEMTGNSPCPNVTSTNDTLSVTTLAAITTPPTGFTVCEDQAINISGSATNAASYQWLLNGSPIAPTAGTNNPYTVTSAAMSDSGMYQLVALSNMAGATVCKADTSSAVLGAVVRKIQITTQPLANTYVCQNSAFDASISANNVTSYQWKKNGVNVSNGTGGTTANYNIASTQPADAGIYTVEMTGNSPCPNVTSTNDTLSVTTLAAITTPPTGFTVCEDQAINISGSATNAASYQWLFNGSPIAPTAGTANPYTKALATMSDSGMYRLVALSANAGATVCKADTSSAVLGAVVRKIQITTQPLAKTYVCQNSAFNASISANNVTSYQWKKNGVNVSNGTGGTTANYGIGSTQPADAGIYTVEMTGNSPCPNVTSTNDTLAVTTLAAITTQPTGTTVCENQSFMLSTSATNAASYQWLFNGSPISGATTSSYSVGSAMMSDSGMYSVVALSNMAGATTCKADTSTPQVLVSVHKAVQITSQPPVFSYGCIGAAFSLDVVAQNATTYNWKKDGVSTGQTGSTFSVNPFSVSDTGTYTVVVSGTAPCPDVVSTNSKVDPTTAAIVITEPVNTDVCLNGTLKLKVVAGAAQSYQWRKNGTDIPGATADSLEITNVGYSVAGSYDVIAIAYFGCTNDTSQTATVTVSTPLSITTPLPATGVHCEGQTVNLTVGVSGTGPYTYNWTLNGNSVGTNSHTYTKSNVTIADSGAYTVSIMGSPVCPAVSSTTAMDINKAPVVTTQPNGSSPICLGSNSTLSTSVSNTTGIEWYKVGLGNTGQSGTTYAINNAVVTDGGAYYVIAKAETMCTDVSSDTITVQINIPALVVSHPQGAAILADPAGSHTLSVIATGTGPLSYQWYREGVAIAGANSSSYVISTYIETLDSGIYYCEVTLPAPCSNMVMSNTARLTTIKCPSLVSPTGNQEINLCSGAAFSLDVTATGTKAYQWYRNNVAISGATFANYSIPKADPSHTGVYRCRLFAYNDATCDVTYSDSFIVTVKDQPIITKQPQGISLCAVNTHTMSVEATYGETYQWYRNGIAISPDGDESSYTYNNVNLIGDEFYVEIGNNLCPSAVSEKVILKNVDPASQVYLTGSTVFNLVERCTDANGWTYYATSPQSEQLLLALNKNGNNITAKPDIELMGSIREISPVNSENRGAILGTALFNMDIEGTIEQPYQVKFFYSQEDANLVLSRLEQIKQANGSNFSTERLDLTFIVSTHAPFTSSLWSNLTIPVNTPYTISHKDKEFGVENNVNYVILKNLISPKLGGTAYMDYTLKTSSGIMNVDANGFGYKLYPVPTHDGKLTLEVSSKHMKALTFTVMDMTGRVVGVFNEKHTSLESKHAFDFSSLANGNYQLQITNGEESAIAKFTISK